MTILQKRINGLAPVLVLIVFAAAISLALHKLGVEVVGTETISNILHFVTRLGEQDSLSALFVAPLGWPFVSSTNERSTYNSKYNGN